jgi:hypothetical protein
MSDEGLDMSKFRIEIDTDNAAFSDGGRNAELARILSHVITRLNGGWSAGICRDVNGNRVGDWVSEGDDD